MATYTCSVCEYVHDEDKTGQSWGDLSDDWVCPVCESPKAYFSQTDSTEQTPLSTVDQNKTETARSSAIDLQKTMAVAEPYFTDIQEMAEQLEVLM